HLGTTTAGGALTARATGGNLDLGTTQALSADVRTITSGNIVQTGNLSIANALSLVSAGDITLPAAVGQTAVKNSLSGVISATGTNVRIATGDSASGNDPSVMRLGNITAGGTLAIVNDNGAVTQESGTALAITGTSDFNSAILNGRANITLSSATNNFIGAVSGSAHNIVLYDGVGALTTGQVNTTGDFTATSAAGALSLGSSSIGGVLTANALTNLDLGTASVGSLVAQSDTGNITQAGALNTVGTAAATASNGNISLTNIANVFGGAASLTAVDVSVTSSRGIDFGTVLASDEFTSITGSGSSTGGVTQSGVIEVLGTARFTADRRLGQSATLNGNNLFRGLLVFDTANSGSWESIAATNAVSGGTSSITLPASVGTVALTVPNANVSLVAPGSSPGTASIGNTLTVNTGGNLSQVGSLAVTGATQLNVNGQISLNSAGNNFVGTVSVANQAGTGASTGPVVITDANALTLGSVATTGALTLNAATDLSLGSTSAGALTVNAGQTVTQTAPIAVTGTSGFNVGGALTLTDSANDFTGAVSVAGVGGASAPGPVAIVDANALTLGTVNTTGAASFTAGTDLNLGTTSAGDVTALAGNNLNLGTTTATSLNATATAGDVSQSGPLAVSGATTLSAGDDITLAHASNNFGGNVSVSGNDITITDNAGGLALTSVVASGNLSATSTGGALDLDNAQVAGNINVAGATNVVFGAVTGLGSVTATATAGDISQTGPLQIAGVSNFNALAGAVTLNDAGNDFSGLVNAQARQVSLVDQVGGLLLGDIVTQRLNPFQIVSNTASTFDITGDQRALLAENTAVVFSQDSGAAEYRLSSSSYANNETRGTVTLATIPTGANPA
ncbi:MAG: beta strand repeat-containing protein, partial [Burkholderiales bacterium]